MLDLRFVVENIDEVVKKLSNRNGDFTYLYELVDLSNRRKEIILAVESKKALRNDASKKIGDLKRQKLDATPF
jgi:seryl-tRNA synthetase